jgi:hypothetical protein
MNITRIKSDINGNPRRVIHFTELVTDADRAEAPNDLNRVSFLYRVALNRARKIGGKKFHNKQFGGGIVFQSYCDRELEKDIANLLAS